jgi:DNA helicase-2/ATP-dependent DNA helicase PcrA
MSIHQTPVMNPEQMSAILHVDGPALVLAGAGSGKTQVVTMRIAHLIEIGIPPSEIVAVTFTNKAAGELQSRVRSLCQQNVLACTFHSLCARILRESIQHLGYQPNFTIYDQSDSENLFKTCIKSLGLELEKGEIKSLRSMISKSKNELLGPSDLDKPDIIFYRLYDLYQKLLKDYNALDFDDLLFLTVKLFRAFPEVKMLYQNRWSFLLVDEYQDTNKAQYILTRLLVEKNHNLFVVGDPDQSIYSFRGANIQNILNFKNDYPEAKIIALEQNFRSTCHILTAANALIDYNAKRMKKNLWSDLGDGDKVHIKIAESEQQEASEIIDAILLHQKNYPLSQMAIFYRTNSQSRLYEDALLRNKIAYQIIGGISFYARKEIKDILSLLRLLLCPGDFISFERTINLPKRGIGSTTIKELHTLSQEYNTPIMTVCENLLSLHPYDFKLSGKQKEGLLSFMTAYKRSVAQMHLPIAELISSVIENFRYLEYLKLDEETFLDRKSNLLELITKAVEWSDNLETKPTLASFLEELSLKAQIDDHNALEDSIKLMTFHNSKGLEFPVVFMVGMEEDLFPHINSKESRDAIEEERRLAYVGMTRAKRHLYLSACKYRLIFGAPRIMRPSRFLEELPKEHCHSSSEKRASYFESDFEVGDTVEHTTFGRGVIRKAYESSLGQTFDIYFISSSSLKTLVAKYAKLKKISD